MIAISYVADSSNHSNWLTYLLWLISILQFIRSLRLAMRRNMRTRGPFSLGQTSCRTTLANFWERAPFLKVGSFGASFLPSVSGYNLNWIAYGEKHVISSQLATGFYHFKNPSEWFKGLS